MNTMDALDYAVGVLFMSSVVEEVMMALAKYKGRRPIDQPGETAKLVTRCLKSLRSVSEMMLVEEDPMPDHVLQLMDNCRSRVTTTASVMVELIDPDYGAEEEEPDDLYAYDSDGYVVRKPRRKSGRKHRPRPRSRPGALLDAVDELERSVARLRDEVETVFLWRQPDEGKTRAHHSERPKEVREIVRHLRLAQIKKLRRSFYLQLRLGGRDAVQASAILDSLLSSVERVWSKEVHGNPNTQDHNNLKHIGDHYGSIFAGRMRVGGASFVDVLVNINDLDDDAFISGGTAEFAGMELGSRDKPEEARVEWSKGKYNKLHMNAFIIEPGTRTTCCFPMLSVGLQAMCEKNPWVRADDATGTLANKLWLENEPKAGKPRKYLYGTSKMSISRPPSTGPRDALPPPSIKPLPPSPQQRDLPPLRAPRDRDVATSRDTVAHRDHPSPRERDIAPSRDRGDIIVAKDLPPRDAIVPPRDRDINNLRDRGEMIIAKDLPTRDGIAPPRERDIVPSSRDIPAVREIPPSRDIPPPSLREVPPPSTRDLDPRYDDSRYDDPRRTRNDVPRYVDDFPHRSRDDILEYDDPRRSFDDLRYDDTRRTRDDARHDEIRRSRSLRERGRLSYPEAGSH